MPPTRTLAAFLALAVPVGLLVPVALLAPVAPARAAKPSRRAAPPPPAPRPPSTTEAAVRLLGGALVDARAWETLAHLCDRIGPRLSGSAALDQAIRFTSAELGTYGLDRVWTEPVQVPHWERGGFEARLVAPVEAPLVGLALGGSVATAPEGIEAEVVAVASFDELAALGERVRGKIVLYDRRMTGWEDYGKVAPLRTRGAIEAAKLGGVAALVRSLATAELRVPHTGAMRYDDAVPRIPAAAITGEDADHIQRLLRGGGPVRVSLRMSPRTLPDAPSANVLAELRGRERPEEVVVIGAHLDSWDVGCGAHDDGAGVAIVMHAMRVMGSLGVRPRRTVRAVLFTNEENGLAGGKAYAAAHLEEMARHVAAVETDSGGGRPSGASVTAGEGAVAALAEILRPLAALRADEATAGGGGADISPMKAHGVPQIGLRQDTTHYFDVHHSEADTVDKVDPRDLALNVAAMAVLAWGLAERETALAPIPLEKRDDD